MEDGAGAGVSINPIAFLVVQSNVVKLLPVDHSNVLDKILDYVPDLIDKANCMMNKCIQNKKDLGDKLINNMKKKCEEKIKKPDIEKVDKKEDDKGGRERDEVLFSVEYPRFEFRRVHQILLALSSMIDFDTVWPEETKNVLQKRLEGKVKNRQELEKILFGAERDGEAYTGEER